MAIKFSNENNVQLLKNTIEYYRYMKGVLYYEDGRVVSKAARIIRNNGYDDEIAKVRMRLTLLGEKS